MNLADANDFVLIVAWLLGALRAGGPYPVLAIAGEQGSAKTVLSKLLRALVDPNVAPVRALPRDERELFIAASNGHVLAFDNLSGLPPWLSDTLCRLTSGGAFSTRRLFTDQDEMLFAAARPIILNGIEEVITRPDLADRAILLMLAPIAERRRRPETALWREFELARPRILGALTRRKSAIRAVGQQFMAGISHAAQVDPRAKSPKRVCSNPALSEEVETLAREIAGPGANAETQDLAPEG